MFRRTLFIFLVLSAGISMGVVLNRTSTLRSAYAQENNNHILVRGDGRAISLERLGEAFTLIPSDRPRHAIRVIPAGKRFVVTDIMYIAQNSVRQNLTVNIASADPVSQRRDILLQIPISPGESDDVHLCSGYVISSGRTLIAFTNAGIEPGQCVTVDVTGYLVDE